MVDLAEIQAAYYMVAATGVLVAAIFYILNLRVSQRNMKANLETRQAQLFMGVYQTWATRESQRELERVLAFKFKDYEEWVNKYGPIGDNPEDHSSWDFVMTYMDGLGSLVKRELIDPRFVAELMGLPVIYTYQKFLPVVMEMRKNSPFLYSNFEVLYNVVNDLVPGQSFVGRSFQLK